MPIGPSTKNSALADVLMSVCENDYIYTQLTRKQREALIEAEQRIRENAAMDDEGDDE